MSKHLVDHACGHPAENALTGRADRQVWEAKRRAADPCPVCYRAGVDSDNALNAAYAAEQALPALEGTARQVEWAVTIRAEFLAGLPDKLAKLDAEIARKGGPALTERAEALAVITQLALAETSAVWWIRTRLRLPDGLYLKHQAMFRRKGAGNAAGRLLLWAGLRGDP